MPDPINPTPSPAPKPSDPTPTPTPSPEPDPKPDDPTPDPAPSPDGAKGGKAAILAELASERRKRQDAEQRAKDLEEANQSEAEKALAAARREGETDADKKWRERNGKLVVKTVATGKFAKADDALAFLDEIPYGSDGEVDETALTEKLEAILEERPYLAAGDPLSPSTPPVPRGPQLPGGSTDPSEMSMDEYRKSKGRTAV